MLEGFHQIFVARYVRNCSSCGFCWNSWLAQLFLKSTTWDSKLWSCEKMWSSKIHPILIFEIVEKLQFHCIQLYHTKPKITSNMDVISKVTTKSSYSSVAPLETEKIRVLSAVRVLPNKSDLNKRHAGTWNARFFQFAEHVHQKSITEIIH